MASVGAVLSLVDGPTGCDPAFCVVWFRFRLLRRYLAIWPTEVGRVYRLLEMVTEGSPGHDPFHSLFASAETGFRWDPLALAWTRPGLPLLSHLAGPVQHLKAAIPDAWRNKVAGDLCGRDGFRGRPLLDVFGSLQLLNSSHVRERDKALLRSVMVGGVWNGFLLGRVRGQPVPCRFCGAPDGDGHLFGECTFPPLVEIRENPELMRMAEGHWPRCLHGHGWLPLLPGVSGACPWAADASQSARHMVENALGPYSRGMLAEWSRSDPEQVIEVPKIFPDDVPMRTTVRDTQLVEVPTIVYSSLLRRIVEQNVDIPVPGLGGRFAGLQGFLREQKSTPPSAQIVDNPAPVGGLQGFRPGQSSSSFLHSPAGSDDDVDEPGEGFFSHSSPS